MAFFSGQQNPQNLSSVMQGINSVNPVNLENLIAMGGSSADMAPQPVSIPGTMGGLGGGNGINLAQGLNLGLGGLQTIGNIIASFKALSLANKQFSFQKDFATKNMANQVSTFNTALADRARSRAAMEGQTAEQAQAYVDKNKLSGMGG